MEKEKTIITVKVTPNAKKSEVIGWREGMLWVKVAAVPDKGRANEALIEFLAKEWGVKRSEIEILSGETSRIKRIRTSRGPVMPQDL